MKLMKFFASLKRLLALEYAKSAIGAVPQEAIRTIIIPNLQREAARVKNPADKDRIEGVIALYEKAADPHSSEGDMFRNTAVGTIRNVAEKYKRGTFLEDEIDEAAQDIATKFFSRPDWMKVFDEPGFPIHEAIKGPSKLNSSWSAIVYRQALTYFRDLLRRRKHEQPLEELVNEGEEGEGRSWEESIPGKGGSPFDESVLEEIEGQLKEYVYRHVKDPVSRRMFDIFFDVAKQKGADRVVMKKDVYPVLLDEGFPLSRSTASDKFRQLLNVFVDFFEDSPTHGGLGIKLNESLKRRILLSAERVAKEFMFRAFARWMLAGIPPRRYRE